MKHFDERSLESRLDQAAEYIREAGALMVCAGAGMGVDSGLPDFRGNEGFWKAYPPFAKLGHSFIDMANPSWFERDPHLAWGFYGHRLNLYRNTTPHKGFEFLLKWGRKKTGGYFVFTSNVDGQFQAAGFDDDRITECHGSIHHMQCAEPCNSAIWPGEGTAVDVDENTMNARDPLPACTTCGEIARPNILMFGDWNWIAQRTENQHYRLNQWLQHNQNAPIVIVECGAGTGVPTVRLTSERFAGRFDARLIRINVREPETPLGQLGFPMPAMDALCQIDARL